MNRGWVTKWALMVCGLALASGTTADGIEDCGLTESDQFVGVLLVSSGFAMTRQVTLFTLNADGGSYITANDRDDTFAAYGGDAGYTAVEAGFSFLVRLPPERLKRWPVEPHCEFTAHNKYDEAYDSKGYVFKLGPEDLGVERAEWEQWDFDANGLTAFRQYIERARHIAGITWTKRGGPVEPFEMEKEQNEVLADASAGCPDLPEDEATVAVWRTRSGCWGGCGPAGCTDISKKELVGVLAVVYDESVDSLGESCELAMAEGSAVQINPGFVTIHRLNRRLGYSETNAQLAWRKRDKGDGAAATEQEYREGDCHF